MNGVLAFLISFFSGYTISLIFTHPEKKKNKLPKIQLKNVEILPNLKIHIRNTTFHIHHWTLFSVMTVSTFLATDGFFSFLTLKGVFIGCLVQGLRYKDRFRFRLPRS